MCHLKGAAAEGISGLFEIGHEVKSFNYVNGSIFVGVPDAWDVMIIRYILSQICGALSFIH